MTQQKGEVPLPDDTTEDSVAEYLRAHPEFFDRQPGLLVRLRLPHATGGTTVSLVERQVAMLRERCGKLERQLQDLVAVAKFNDGLVDKMHQLALRVIAAPDIATRLRCIETSLREDFMAQRAVLILFAERAHGASSDGFVRVLEQSDPTLAAFGSFLKSPRPRCGLRRRQCRSHGDPRTAPTLQLQERHAHPDRRTSGDRPFAGQSQGTDA